MNYRIVHKSIVGRAHLQINKGCEDACVMGERNGVRAVCICDGAGSFRMSRHGADITSKMVVDWLLTNADELLSIDLDASNPQLRKLKNQLLDDIFTQINNHWADYVNGLKSGIDSIYSDKTVSSPSQGQSTSYANMEVTSEGYSNTQCAPPNFHSSDRIKQSRRSSFDRIKQSRRSSFDRCVDMGEEMKAAIKIVLAKYAQNMGRTPILDRIASLQGYEYGAERITSACRLQNKIVLDQVFMAIDDLVSSIKQNQGEASERSAILKECSQMSNSCPENQYSCTIVGFLITEDGRWVTIHLGDGGIIGKSNDQLRILSRADNAQFANYTWFITSEDAIERMRITRSVAQEDTNLEGVILFSDGVEDLFIVNSVPQPGTGKMIGSIFHNGDTFNDGENQLYNFIKNKLYDYSTDDITIALVKRFDDENFEPSTGIITPEGASISPEEDGKNPPQVITTNTDDDNSVSLPPRDDPPTNPNRSDTLLNWTLAILLVLVLTILIIVLLDCFSKNKTPDRSHHHKNSSAQPQFKPAQGNLGPSAPQSGSSAMNNSPSSIHIDSSVYGDGSTPNSPQRN